MRDKPEQVDPEGERHPRVLGEIPAGEFDTELNVPPTRKKGPEAQEPSSAPAPRVSRRRSTPRATPSTGNDRVMLPRGGLIAMRRSGGLRFTSRQVVIYRDGRVTAEPDPALAEKATAPRRLSDEELAALYRALEQADLPSLRATPARRNPDAYTYEIVARTGASTSAVVVSDGGIPGQLAPLIALLSTYLRPGE